MTKILIGAAVLAMFATSCQNDEIVDNVESTGKGEFFTLEVGKGFESRTVLSGSATHWCKDDAVFVSGAGGKVSGVLNFDGYVGSDKSQAKFSGWISGGQPSELKHIVFPVPQGGKIDMAKRDPNKLDAPMIGTIGDGTVQTLNNVGGLLAFKMEGCEGQEFEIGAFSEDDCMVGGFYEFDPESGKLKYTPDTSWPVVKVSEDGFVFVPVATTTSQTDGTEASQEVTVDVQVYYKGEIYPIIYSDGVGVTQGEIVGDDESTGLDVSIGEKNEIISIVKNEAELEDKVGWKDHVVKVKLGADIIVNDKLMVAYSDLTIDLNGYTIKNTENSEVDVIYAHDAKVTIEGDGSVRSVRGSNACVITAVGKSEVIINGGNFINENDVESIYSYGGGRVTINKGYFESTGNPTDAFTWPQYPLLNEHDDNRKTIIVNGGTFKNFNPANNYSEGPNTNFVSDNHKVIVNEGSIEGQDVSIDYASEAYSTSCNKDYYYSVVHASN